MPPLKGLSQQGLWRIHFTIAGALNFTAVAIPVEDYFEIVEARESHTVAGTDGAAVTLTVEKLTGTQAPGGGQNMFKTSTFNLKGTANTVQRLASSQLTSLSAAQRAGQQVSPGDRICIAPTGTLTTLQGVSLILVLRPTRPKANRYR